MSCNILHNTHLHTVSFSNVLPGSGAGGVTIWGRDPSFVGANVQEAGGGARGVPQTVDGKDGQAVEEWDLEKRGRGDCTKRRGNADTGGVH